MLRTLLLCFAVAGLQARPLQNDALQLQNGGWILNSPQLVQDQYLDSIDKPVWEVVRATDNEAKVQDKPSWKSAPVEERRQGTEPSRRFLMDLNTGMLKEHISEMDRRVSGFYNYPSNYEFRQGTQNSQAILVDIKTGQLLPQSSEMQRNTVPSDESRRDMENSPASPVALRKTQIDLGSTNDVATDITPEAVPPELRRQGTEPSRRLLVDFNTGMLKEHISEMDRRVSGFYNYPSNQEFRQGTQNSQAALVDIRTGQLYEPISEMQRSAALASEDRQGNVHPHGNPKVLQNHVVENTEAIISSVIEGPSHLKEFRHGEGVAICQGLIVDGKCYHLNRNS